MKKITILFLSVLTLGLSVASCSSDDDNDGGSASIEGKWQVSLEGETLATLEAPEDEGSCGTDIIEFSKGGAFTVTGLYYSNSKCNPYSEKGTWSKKDQTITIKHSEGEDTNELTIVELTASTLKVKEVDEEGTWYTVFVKK